MSDFRRSASGRSFSRRRALTTAAGIASAGALAGLSLIGGGAANATTASDCTATNTVNAAGGGDETDIQNLLNAGGPDTICLMGTFSVLNTLEFGRTVTIYGLSDAVLDAGSTDHGILFVTDASTLTLQNLRLTGGRAFQGGAVFADSLVVIDSEFDGNSSAYRGGAFVAGTADVSGSTFTGNSSGEYGGAIVVYGVLTLDSSTFDSNTSQFEGGAIDVGSSTVTNSTFVDNSISDPTGNGGALLSGGGGSVTQSTFVGNTTPDPTGGEAIWVGGGSTFDLALGGDLFVSAAGTTQVAVDGETTHDEGGNVFTTSQATENYFSGTDTSTIFGQDGAALVGSGTLANNGGPAKTVALVTGSPAINAVPSTSAAAAVTVDERGWNRVALNDSGAYEFGAVDPDAVTAPPPAPTLAATGSDPGWLVWLALALLAAGTAIAARMTQRSRRTSRS